MKITSFCPLLNDTDNRGLHPIKMQKLGMIVALAGANGAGKSRALESLKWHASSGHTRYKSYADAKTNILNFRNVISQRESQEQNEDTKIDIRNYKNAVIEQLLIIEKYEAIETDFYTENVNIINFVPKSLNLTDPSSKPANQIQGGFASALNPGIDAMQDAAPLYIQHLQNEWHEATHQNFSGDANIISNIKRDYESLKKLIKDLLKTDISRQSGQVTLFGKQLAAAALSDGQKVLLQLVVALHAQKETAGQILLMDEPENHLHPAALIEVFERIQNALPTTQVWVATHSVPLLAHLYSVDPACIWYIQNGSVAFAGKRTEEVLTSLLGDTAQRNKLLQFLELPHQLAATNFASQCLTNPAVAPLNSGDPQIRQIASVLWSNSKKDKLRLLDIGAGKGRLLGGMAELDPTTTERIDYIAFDPSAKDRLDCEAQLTSIYSSAKNRWFNNENELFVNYDEKTFDAIVICNVLHEIEPDSWLSIFGVNGIFQKALSKTGYLIIIEDMRIPVGELPNHRGFFLLDTLHLKKLFQITEADINAKKFLVDDARGDNRLKAHLISADLLSRITKDTRTAAIKELASLSKIKIDELRKTSSPTFDTGQQHGLWSQQLANCILYLEQVDGT